ncbi:MAG: gliding motility protein [Aquificota bacterium]|nr:MAG: gliding motility protein [Aquificota bacterium]
MMELRIVYHGLGMAGKTTNLEKLKEIYSGNVYERFHQQTSEGRTVYLDVLTLKLKTKIEGLELLISLFTTPGQKRFSLLRPWLFGHTSSVVFVFDSTRSIEENLESFQEIGNSKVVVVQANKRDVEGAIPLEDIKRAFADYPVIPATAKEGIGVVETFKEAVRLALEHDRKVYRTS